MGHSRKTKAAVRILAEVIAKDGYQPDLVLLIGTATGDEVPEMKRHWADARYLGYDAVEDFVRQAGEHLETHYSAVQDDPEATEIDFYLRPRKWIASSRWAHHRGIRNKLVKVPATTLDKIREKHGLQGMKTILWLDSEGGELGTMCGGPEMMKQADYLNVEMTPEGLGREGWPDSKLVHKWITDNGFERIHIHHSKPETVAHDAIYRRLRDATYDS